MLLAMSRNLLNLSACTLGYYLNASGTPMTSADDLYSDFIPVSAGEKLWIYSSAAGKAGNRRLHGYSSNRTWLQQIAVVAVTLGSSYDTGGITIPANVAYIRFSFNQNDQQVMMEKGSKTSYQPYGENSSGGGEVNGIHFRLPLSNTSTHKSINPSILKLITSDGEFSYDGSEGVTIDISNSLVTGAETLTNNPTIGLTGGAITNTSIIFNGSEDVTLTVNKLDADYITLGTLSINHGGTGKTSWTEGGLLYASSTTALSQVAVGTSGQILQQSTSGPTWVNPSSLSVGSASIAESLQNGNLALGCGYGRCSTSSTTSAKTVSMTAYDLVEGGIVAILFDQDVKANASLNINSRGSKSIQYHGNSIPNDIIHSGDIAVFMYTNNQYQLLMCNSWNNIARANGVSF